MKQSKVRTITVEVDIDGQKFGSTHSLKGLSSKGLEKDVKFVIKHFTDRLLQEIQGRENERK